MSDDANRTGDPFSERRWRLRCRDRELTAVAGQPLIAGVLNVTPDSFFDGSRFTSPERAVMHAGLMIDAGAQIVDIGGASSRPKGKAYGAGAEVVPPELELARILPVVKTLASDFPEAVLSIDTYHPDVARACLEAGAHIINDITGLRLHPEMAEIVAEFKAGLILMHSTGKPGDMPHVVDSQDIIDTVRHDLANAVDIAERAGVTEIITDPGFGFGKTTRANYRLLNELDGHRIKDYPIMVGVSRKSSIGVALGNEQFPVPVYERLFGSLGATAVAVMRGAAIVRTHDVGATAEMVRVMGVTLDVDNSSVTAP